MNEDVVEIARTQVRVARFRHQGRVWNKHLDCIGLVTLSHKRAGYPYYDYANYGRNPNPKQLYREFGKVADPVDDPESGDIVLLKVHAYGVHPHHVAIYDVDTIIHAHMETNFVQEVPYAEPWVSNTFGFFRWRR